jgi:CBS domain-containing protein
MVQQRAQVPQRPIAAARSTLVRDIMTRDPVTVRPETGVEQVIDLFVGRGIGHVPVVDDDGRAVGMISKTDVIRDVHLRGDTEVDQSPGAMARDLRRMPPAAHVHEADDQARDVMTPVVLWVPETASIAEAARVIASGQLHALLVARHDGVVVGILSANDIVAWVADAAS